MTSEGSGEKTEDQGREGKVLRPRAFSSFPTSAGGNDRLSRRKTACPWRILTLQTAPRFIIVDIRITGGMSWGKSCDSSNFEEHGEGTLSKK